MNLLTKKLNQYKRDLEDKKSALILEEQRSLVLGTIVKNCSIVSRNLELFLISQKLKYNTDNILDVFINTVQSADAPADMLDELDDDLIDEYNEIVKSLDFSMPIIRKLLETRLQAITTPTITNIKTIKKLLIKVNIESIKGETNIKKFFIKNYGITMAEATALSLIMFDAYKDFRKFQINQRFVDKIKEVLGEPERDNTIERSAIKFVNYDTENSRIENQSKVSQTSENRNSQIVRNYNNSQGTHIQMSRTKNPSLYKDNQCNRNISEFTELIEKSHMSTKTKKSAKNEILTKSDVKSVRKDLKSEVKTGIFESEKKTSRGSFEDIKDDFEPQINESYVDNKDAEYLIKEENDSTRKIQRAHEKNEATKVERQPIANTTLINDSLVTKPIQKSEIKQQPSDDELNTVALKIQSVFKGKKDRQKVADMKKAQKENKRLDFAAVKIQKIYKGKKCRKEFQEKKDKKRKEEEIAAIKIQKAYKVKKQKKIELEKQRQQEEKAALKIQKAFKRRHRATNDSDIRKKINLNSIMADKKHYADNMGSKYEDTLAEETINQSTDNLRKINQSNFNEQVKQSQFSKLAHDSSPLTNVSKSKQMNYENLLKEEAEDEKSNPSVNNTKNKIKTFDTFEKENSTNEKIKSNNKTNSSFESMQSRSRLDAKANTAFINKSTDKNTNTDFKSKTTFALTNTLHIEPKCAREVNEHKSVNEPYSPQYRISDIESPTKKSHFSINPKTQQSAMHLTQTPLNIKNTNNQSQVVDNSHRNEPMTQNKNTPNSKKDPTDFKGISKAMLKDIYKSAINDIKIVENPQCIKKSSSSQSVLDSNTSSSSDDNSSIESKSSKKKNKKSFANNSKAFSNADNSRSKKSMISRFDTSSFDDN